jgi:hypothetical protein
MAAGAAVKVPDRYLGVWKRTRLRASGVEDTTSAVYWLQTARRHADIRIPADRPACLGKAALAELSRSELEGLARQQGFAGITEVQGELCRWHRKMDFQPPSRYKDIGRMEFDTPERCLEHGVEQDYFEIWERLPESRGETVALELPGTPGLLLRAGSCMMRVRPRVDVLPIAENLAALAAGADDQTLRRWLDFEVSFGWIGSDGSRIVHSTLPWLEGQRIEETDVATAAAAGMLGRGARHWRTLD